MNCSEFFYQGLSQCKAFREKVTGVIMTDKTFSTTADDMKDIATWAGLFGTDPVKGMYIPFDRGYQNNSTEPEITTSNLGHSEKTFDNPPMIKGFADIGWCDYKTLYQADGQDFNFFLVLRDGTIEGTTDSTGKITGYRGRMFFHFNAPNADNLQESYPVDIYFSDAIEWRDRSVSVHGNFSITDLIDAVPVGITMSIVTAYAAASSQVVVHLSKRCLDEPLNLPLAATDFKLVVTGDVDPGVTTIDTTDAGNGNYTLTVESDVSTAATAMTKPFSLIMMQGTPTAMYLSNIVYVEV